MAPLHILYSTRTIRNIAGFFLVVLASFTASAQVKKPIGNCIELKQEFSQAIKTKNGAAVNQIGQQLNNLDCYKTPKLPPALPVVKYRVGNVQTISYNPIGPGEGQSTVIAPGQNPKCAAGALLVSNDWYRPASSIVTARALSGGTADVVSTFHAPPHPEYYSYVTNDHDLIALSDGSVLYLTGAGSVEPLSPTPAWWNVTSLPGLGSGARSNLMVWRSTDCGANFYYLSEMDPANMEDGSCANPQFRRDAKGNAITAQPYAMGGSDGQLVKLDPATGNLYLTFRCVGNVGQVGSNGKFTLTQTGLNKTLVAVSTNQGGSWSSLGFIDGVNFWRFPMLPMGNSVAFAFWNSVMYGGPSNGKFTFGPSQTLSGANGGFAWTQGPYNPNPSPDPTVWANVWANTLIARSGDDPGLVVGFPTVVAGNGASTNGFSLFFVDSFESSVYSEAKPIVPMTNSTADYVMHPTAIDLGRGPVLLYWLDVNTTTQKARVRGRIITGFGHYTDDFDISSDLDLTLPPLNAYPNPPFYFQGDYRTASGYEQRVVEHAGQKPPLKNSAQGVYYFYPLWVERTGAAKFALIEVAVDESLPSGSSPINLKVTTVTPESWKRLPPAVDVITLKSKALPHVREMHEPAPNRRPVEQDRR